MLNKLSIIFIRFYQKYLRFIFGGRCRHTPTCSNYGIEAFKKHHFFYASFLTIKRIIKCNPWGSFVYDPVPEPKKKKNKV